MELREYQNSFVNNIARALTKFKKVIGQLATGGGKTVVFSSISDRYIKKANKRVLILVHRKELLQQTRHTAYDSFGLICQPIIAGMKYIPPADIYVGMVETTWRRLLKLPNIGLVIIDECHRLEFAKFHSHFTDQLIIGFSATPLSSSKKKPMKLYFDDIVCGVDIPQLIAEGYLCQNITWAPKDTVNRLELIMKGEEFDEESMSKAFSKPKYIQNTVNAYQRWASGTKAIIFNVNVLHSQEVTKALCDAGLNAKHIDGETPAHDRTRILHWFKTTPDAILCNVGIATMGFDEPTIETVIVNRATMSMPLWIQMCGRGSRPNPMKTSFTIIDMGGNAITHGDWCQARDWKTIFHHPPKAGKETAAPVKSCPACDAIIPAAAKVCPYCGFVYPSKSIPIETELHEFIVVTKNINVQRLTEDHKEKKLFYPFFEIGRRLAEHAQKTIPEMTDEFANFIAIVYDNLAREWTRLKNKKYNQYLQMMAREHLFSELKARFRNWKTELKVNNYKMEITNIEPLENL